MVLECFNPDDNDLATTAQGRSCKLLTRGKLKVTWHKHSQEHQAAARLYEGYCEGQRLSITDSKGPQT